jgi:hypothetical protein
MPFFKGIQRSYTPAYEQRDKDSARGEWSHARRRRYGDCNLLRIIQLKHEMLPGQSLSNYPFDSMGFTNFFLRHAPSPRARLRDGSRRVIRLEQINREGSG